MRLRVKTLTGAVLTVEVTEADDIAAKSNLYQLQDRVASATGFGVDGLRLLHAGELLRAGPIRHTRLLDGDFIVAVVAKQTKPAAAPPPDIKMTEAAPAKKDKKDEKDEKDKSSSESDIPKPAAVSSPEPPPPVDAAIPNELRAQLQDLMMGLLDLAGQNRANQPPAQPAAPAAEIVVDPALIQQLVDMGFPQNRARKALILSRLNLQRAMEWILEHENDPDVDAPLPPGGPPPAAKPAAGVVDGGDAQAVQRLQEMGFSAEDVQQALRATNFNYEAACAWLLGDRDGAAAAAAAAGEDQGDEEEEEVDDNNPMIAAILNNPQIQNSLTPRVVQAFQAMMDNPGSTAEYINDPEVGPVILQVLQIVRGGNAANPPAAGDPNAGLNAVAAALSQQPSASSSGSNPPSPSPQPKGPPPPPGGSGSGASAV